MASTSLVEAVVERMMERLQKENPGKEFYKRKKKEKVPRKKKPAKLH